MNPLDPAYNYPGHTEPGAGLDAYGDGRDGCSMFKSFTQVALPVESEKAGSQQASARLPPKSQTSHASKRSEIVKTIPKQEDGEVVIQPTQVSQIHKADSL